MHVTQERKRHAPPPPLPVPLTRAEVQRRYRTNVQRRLRTLEAIEQLLAELKESEE